MLVLHETVSLAVPQNFFQLVIVGYTLGRLAKESIWLADAGVDNAGCFHRHRNHEFAKEFFTNGTSIDPGLAARGRIGSLFSCDRSIRARRAD